MYDTDASVLGRLSRSVSFSSLISIQNERKILYVEGSMLLQIKCYQSKDERKVELGLKEAVAVHERGAYTRCGELFCKPWSSLNNDTCDYFVRFS